MANPMLVAGAAVVLTWLVWALLDRYIWQPLRILRRLWAQGVPGFPFVPVLGQIVDFIALERRGRKDPAWAATQRATQFTIDACKKYGKTWTLCLGSRAVLLTVDPALARQAMVTKVDSFEKPMALRLVKMLGNGLVLSEGDFWARQRRLINPAFHMKEIRRLFRAMQRCAADAVRGWEEAAAMHPGQPVRIDDELSTVTLSIITATAFGMHLQGREDGEKLLRKLQRCFLEYFEDSQAARNMEMAIPYYSWLPTSVNRKMWRSERFIRHTMKDIINSRVAEARSTRDNVPPLDGPGTKPEDGNETMNGESSGGVHLDRNAPEHASRDGDEHVNGGDPGDSSNVDLLQLMLMATEGHGRSVDHAGGSLPAVPMSEQQLMDECLTFLIAGHETTATLLTWTVYLLSQHREWRDRARAEVLQMATGADWVPSFEEVGQMRVCQWVLQEVLRFIPPVAGVMRTCTRDTELTEGLTIPAGCDLLVAMEAMNVDKGLWGPDADEFNPERFAEGVGKAAMHPGAYMPFGLGPRVCIGQNFAMIEAKLILALLLTRFEWRMHDSYAHYPWMSFTVRPRRGMPVVLSPLHKG